MSLEIVLLIVATVEVAILFRMERVNGMRWQVYELFGRDVHATLPSFAVMVLKFWIWNAETFLRREGNQ